MVPYSGASCSVERTRRERSLPSTHRPDPAVAQWSGNGGHHHDDGLGGEMVFGMLAEQLGEQRRPLRGGLLRFDRPGGA